MVSTSTNKLDRTVRLGGSEQPAPGPGDNSGVSGQTLVDTAAIAGALKSGERLTISVKDGVISAQKQGPDVFNQTTEATSGVAGGAGNVLVNILNGTAGADPTVAVLTVAQAANAMLSSFNFIPSAVSAPFAANFYQYFRTFAPILSGTKLVNTWKSMGSQAKLHDPKIEKPTLKQRLGNGRWVNLAVDAAHFALDVGVAALTGVFILNTFGWAIPIPALVPGWMDMTHALAIGFAGDVVAGVFHGVGAAAEMANPNNGANFGERASKFVRNNGFSSVFSRVFRGQDSLLPKDPPHTPPVPPDNDDDDNKNEAPTT